MCPSAFWEVETNRFPLHITISQGKRNWKHKRPKTSCCTRALHYTQLKFIFIVIHLQTLCTVQHFAASPLALVRVGLCLSGSLICRPQEVQESTGFCGNKLRWKTIPETFGMILSCCAVQKKDINSGIILKIEMK